MTRLLGRTVYLDANVFIYVVESVAPYADALRPLFASIAAGETPAVTSEITLAETLVKPFRVRDPELGVRFRSALEGPGLTLASVTREVLVQSARLRAASRMKLPDAVHAATAQLAGCDVLLTNDTGIGAVPGVDVVRLAEVVGEHG